MLDFTSLTNLTALVLRFHELAKLRNNGLAFNFREPVAFVPLAPIKVRNVKVLFSSGLLATAVFVGMEGQSPHNCPWCQGNPPDFKNAAGLEKKALLQRTAAI